MTKQSIHDFTPEKRLSEIEQYVNGCYKRHMSPILTQREYKLLIHLAKKGLGD